jgi:hypothetical protein
MGQDGVVALAQEGGDLTAYFVYKAHHELHRMERLWM